ncbi:AAA family ATPase [bacterium]|nr:AAA family ATPase [bacterium]
MTESLQEISYLIRARYPIIYIVSSEEERVIQGLQLLGQDRGKALLRWTITQGMFNENTKETSDIRDPLQILDAVTASSEQALFVLQDFHPYLTDPTIVRKLRDIGHTLKSSYKTLVLLSPVVKIPLELEKTLAIVPYDLPKALEIKTIVVNILSSLGKQNIPLPAEAEKNRIVEAALGLTAEEAENVFAKSLVRSGRIDMKVVIAEKEQIIRKSGILEFYPAQEKLGDIGGLEYLKLWLKKRSLAFSQKARDFGLPYPKGILLTGIPGCGKSLTAKVIGNLWQLPLLRLDVGKIFAGLVGSSEENMRRAIQTAESVAPSILWLDEMEKGFSGTQSSSFSDGGTTARVFGNFVTWLQEKTKPVFVVATANNVSLLPPEMLRKGRFDEIFFVDLPNFAERKDIFEIHIRKKKRETKSFDITRLAQQSEGYSGSEIEQAIISALYDAFEVEEELSDIRIIQALKSSVPLSRTMEKEIQGIRQWSQGRARKASLSMEEEKNKGRKLEMEMKG